MDEQGLLNEFAAIEERSMEERLRLVRDAFPEMWEDAEAFVSQHHALPWDFVTGFRPDARRVQDAYGIHLGRSRPRVPDVSARAELFCATCELIAELAARRTDPSAT